MLDHDLGDEAGRHAGQHVALESLIEALPHLDRLFRRVAGLGQGDQAGRRAGDADHGTGDALEQRARSDGSRRQGL